MTEQLSTKIESLPTSTGVYQFYDADGEILYVGKAINLKTRVRSYFHSDHLDRPWVKQMIPIISDVKVLITDNEVEALILESNLITKYGPKYNSAGKDDKRYAWILINTRAPFPKVEKTRDLGRKGRYFGPYPDGRAVNQVLKYLRKLYPYCDCNLEMYPNHDPKEIKKSRLCFYYHLGLCPGPCDNLITSEEYKKNIRNIIKILQGNKKSPIKELEKRMHAYSGNKKFEKAAELRDKIRDLRYLSQRVDIDFGDEEEEFKKIQQTRFLSGITEAIKQLGLNIPEHRIKNTRIECYDISNISGEVTYGSMVVSIGPTIKNSQYRIFKVREKKKSNDPEMLKTVIQRRLKYLESDHPGNLKTSESLLAKPDIIVLDGGKPQLSAVAPIVPVNIGVMAISKGKHLKRAGQEQEDEFWRMDDDGKFRKITFENPFLFQRLRDEAHRFAIKHHRKGRRFEQKKSVLDEIPGIGPKRKKELMKKFKTIEGIKKATREELQEVLKNKAAVKTVSTYFRNDQHPHSTL
jgi:excinuclease ABC subunit C